MLKKLLQNPAKDAAKIHQAIEYKILRAAWDTYVRIKKTGFQKTHKIATPAWFALFAIQNHKGNFSRFDVDELHLLQSFKSVHASYEEIVKELSDHRKDGHLGEHILATHPNLKDVVPDEYYNADKLSSYIIEVIRNYQSMLKEYYERYQGEIDATVARLEKEEAKIASETKEN